MRSLFAVTCAIILGSPFVSVPATAQVNPNPHDPSTIWGFVVELRSGTPDVAVCLCDAETGIPLRKENYQPAFTADTGPGDFDPEMAIVISDEKGRFQFDNVPDGKYRLIAQKWTGPYKGPFELHGTVIQLMGVADNVVVPRPNEYYDAQVALKPPGKCIVEFDQDVGNSATIMFLSTKPPEFDPILGPSALGRLFVANLHGINRMPLGKTTVIGAPSGSLHAFFFAPDNSPGFAAVEITANESTLVRVPPEPFVAGWSDGRKTPPEEIAELMDFMKEHSLTAKQLLKIPKLSYATHEAHRARMKELMTELAKEVELAEGRKARVGDILAADSYARLAR